MTGWTLEDFTRALGRDPLPIKEATAPPDIKTQRSLKVKGISIDSRTIKPGEVFVCIKGDNLDGHKYIDQALEAGATGIILEETYPEIQAVQARAQFVFTVTDGTRSLGDLARFRRGRFMGRVIGVTGSSGKTSAKEMLYGIAREVLSSGAAQPDISGKVFATRGNLNNHWGLPLSILEAPEDAILYIFEMGMNHPGEIEYLSRIARPDMALITSISGGHREFFKSVDAIAEAKLEILMGMSLPGPLAYNRRAPGLDTARRLCPELNIKLVEFGFEKDEDVQLDRRGIRFSWRGREIHNENYLNQVMAWNLTGCLETLAAAGFDEEDLASAANKVAPLTPRRFQVFRRPREAAEEALLIDDSYNANEDSFSEAVTALRRILPDGRLGVIAGEMAELGKESEAAHRRLGELIARENYEVLALAGDKLAEQIKAGYTESTRTKIFQAPDAEDLRKTLMTAGIIEELDGILVKGSRSAQMDIISDALKEKGYV